MSLQLAAQHMASRGRNGDSMLVHMTPKEVMGLQALALAHGGSLTTNPETGLPEANILKSILPTLLGAAGSYLGLSPMVTAGITGVGTALATGNLAQGLSAGLSAYGSADLMGNVMSAGAKALAAEAPVYPAAEELFGPSATTQAAPTADEMRRDSPFRAMSRGFSELTKPEGFSRVFGGNKDAWTSAGLAALPVMSSLMQPKALPTVTQSTSVLRPMSFQRAPNPPAVASQGSPFRQEAQWFGDRLSVLPTRSPSEGYGTGQYNSGGVVAFANGGVPPAATPEMMAALDRYELSPLARSYFQRYGDVAEAYLGGSTFGMSPEDFAYTHFQKFGSSPEERRTWDPSVPPPPPVTPAPTVAPFVSAPIAAPAAAPAVALFQDTAAPVSAPPAAAPVSAPPAAAPISAPPAAAPIVAAPVSAPPAATTGVASLVVQNLNPAAQAQTEGLGALAAQGQQQLTNEQYGQLYDERGRPTEVWRAELARQAPQEQAAPVLRDQQGNIFAVWGRPFLNGPEQWMPSTTGQTPTPTLEYRTPSELDTIRRQSPDIYQQYMAASAPLSSNFKSGMSELISGLERMPEGSRGQEQWPIPQRSTLLGGMPPEYTMDPDVLAYFQRYPDLQRLYMRSNFRTDPNTFARLYHENFGSSTGLYGQEGRYLGRGEFDTRSGAYDHMRNAPLSLGESWRRMASPEDIAAYTANPNQYSYYQPRTAEEFQSRFGVTSGAGIAGLPVADVTRTTGTTQTAGTTQTTGGAAPGDVEEINVPMMNTQAALPGRLATAQMTSGTRDYFQRYPEVANAFNTESYGLNPDEFVATHFRLHGQRQGFTMAPPRAAPLPAALANQQMSQATRDYFSRYSDLAEAYLVNRYGMSPDDYARTHFERYGSAEGRIGTGLIPPAPTPAPAPPPAAPTPAPPPAAPTPAPAPAGGPPSVPRFPMPDYSASARLPFGSAAREYFLSDPRIREAYAENNYDLNPDDFARLHFELHGRGEGRYFRGLSGPRRLEDNPYFRRPEGESDTDITSTNALRYLYGELPRFRRTETSTQEAAASPAETSFRNWLRSRSGATSDTGGTGGTGAGATTNTAADTTRTTTTRTYSDTPEQTAAAQTYFAENPDVAEAYDGSDKSMSPYQFARTHYERYGVLPNERRRWPEAGVGTSPQTGSADDPNSPNWAGGGEKRGGIIRERRLALGGLGSLGGYAGGGAPDGHLGSYSDGGRLLRGPGDGVSDSIPATIAGRQPARLADGEFVIPARIVSELGNGSTQAGARQLYAMMDRVQARRRKTVGKDQVAVDSKARKVLPA